MKTHKLFVDDAYLQTAEATVVDILDLPEEVPLPEAASRQNRILILDQTVFYALSGGQPGDTGTITGPQGEERVVDTRYATDEKVLIYHYLQEPTLLQKGDTVTCQIDWDRRYRLMRTHSLIHITSLVFEGKYGNPPVIGSNMNLEKGRIDYEFHDPIDFDWLNQETQRWIDEGHDIQNHIDPEDPNGVRIIWEMSPLGTMPCGGTHVKNSSEIGKIHLKRKNLSSQGQRIYCMLEE